MKSFSRGFLFSALCLWMINLSHVYKSCLKPDPRKKTYGLSCTENSQCYTDYCSSTARTCACPLSLTLDSDIGLCVKNVFNVTSNPGDCGYIVSPSNISERSEVSWTISGTPETYITIVILEIDMAPDCASNYVEIQEDSTSLLNKNCDRNNSTLRFFASKSNRLTVNYRKVPNDYRGFRAIYYTRSRFSELSEVTGYIVNPGYPLSYNRLLNQTWLISMLPGRIIETIFVVNIRSNADYIKVYDGRSVNSPLLKRLTGSVPLFSVRSSENFMLIQFTTDTVTTHKGFSATYKSYALYGNQCISDDECVQGLVCSYNLCNCSLYEKYDKTTNTCIPRLTKGYECTQTDECNVTLTCISGRCGCQSGYYYDTNRPGCYSALKGGQFCDPSIDDICELPNHICSRSYTSNYTCKMIYNNSYNYPSNYPYASGSGESTCKDNSNTVTVCIAIAVISWIFAFASMIVMCKLCGKNRTNARHKGNIPITQSSQVTARTTPTSLPNNTGQIRNTSTMASRPVVSQVQTTVSGIKQTTPATSSTSTTTTTTNVSTNNPNLSVTHYSRHANQTYARNNTNSFEETYENILAYINDDRNEEVYINVQFPKQNTSDNSNI